MGDLYTIGHSRYDFSYFLNLLQMHGIQYVLDVRSTPYSKYAADFNRETVAESLSAAGIRYCFMGAYFGARQTNPDLYTPEGYLDFEKTSHSEPFLRAKENVRLGLYEGYRIALMCTEKDPIDCHRAIMVGRAFAIDGIEVNHILPDGKIQTQAELDQRLLNRYYPGGDQLTLFDFQVAPDTEERIREAYRKRNKQIGYRLADLGNYTAQSMPLGNHLGSGNLSYSNGR